MNVTSKLISLAVAAVVHGSVFASPCSRSVDVPGRLLSSRLHLLGELHGTRQIPEFVYAYVCSLSERVDGVVLALELSAQDQALIDAFLASNGSIEDRKALLGSKEWSLPIRRQDGRTSAAMLALLDEVRRHNRSQPKRRIAVAAISAPNDTGMSANVRALMQSAPGKHVIVLTGDIHASKEKGNEFDAAYEPMGFLLKDLSPVTLIADYEQGTAWNCREAQCAVQPAFAIPNPRDQKYSISLTPPPQPVGFEGTFYVGKVDASEPAISSP